MRELIIDGGRRLSGEIKISRAKNSVLALMAASLMIRGEISRKKSARRSLPSARSFHVSRLPAFLARAVAK